MSHGVDDDELLPHTEPCGTCTTGIERMVCFDGVRRCRNCVLDYAAERGWDQVPEGFLLKPDDEEEGSADDGDDDDNADPAAGPSGGGDAVPQPTLFSLPDDEAEGAS